VNCIQAKTNSQGGNDPVAWSRKAARYLSLAHSYAQHFGRPTIWVVCGLPAAGKSTIARALSKTIAATTLRSDVIRKQLFGKSPHDPAVVEFDQDIYGPAAHRLTYDKLLQLARKALEKNQSIILDATFSQPEQRRHVIRLTDELDCTAVFIECTAPDRLLKDRLLKRESGPSVSDAREHHFEMLKRKYVPMDPSDRIPYLQVDTTRPVHDCVRKIMSWDYSLSLKAGHLAEKSAAMPHWKGGSHVQNNSGSYGPNHRKGTFGGNGGTSGRRQPRPAVHPPRP
jgi:predicted kinase